MVQAWSIGAKLPQKEQVSNPGPGQYSSRNDDSKKSKPPEWTIGTSKRNVFNTRALSPGPGAYKTIDDKNSAPKYHFGTKSTTSLDKFKKMVPGPGQYEPQSNAFNKTAFSFGGRHILQDKNAMSKPGPGAYSLNSTLTKSLGKFGTSNKWVPLVSKLILSNPGPGQYTDSKEDTLKKSAPKYGFGSSTRTEEKSTKIRQLFPGPGHYSSQTNLGHEAPKYSLVSRRPDTAPRAGRNSPGPGNYNPTDSFTKTQMPKCKFGNSIRKDLKRDASPSPDAYSINKLDSRKHNSPSFGFGSSNRKPLSETSFSPGPGNYSIPSKITEKNGYYMGAKISDLKKDQYPGPGNYNPEVKLSKQGSPNYAIGTSSRGASNKYLESVPGPGNYNYYNPSLDKGPKVKIGTETREHNIKNETPGPGAYKIPVKIMDVPRYVLQNQEEQFKFV